MYRLPKKSKYLPETAGVNASSYAQKEHNLIIDKFLGVDFTNGEFITDYRRSPDAKNTVWGTNPYLYDTRTGRGKAFENRIVDSNGNSKVNGIHHFKDGTADEVLIHIGTELFKWVDGSEPTKIIDSEYEYFLDAPSTSFMMEGNLFILTGKKYLVYDGARLQPVEDYDGTFIPTTVIGRQPTGGGTAYEAVNILTDYHKNDFYAYYKTEEQTATFSGDGTTTEFTISTTKALTEDAVIVYIGDVLMTNVINYSFDYETKTLKFVIAPESGTNNITVKYFVKEWIAEYKLDSKPITNGSVTVFKLNANGVWVKFPETEGEGSEAVTNYTVNYTDGVVTFAEAPTELEGLGGVDNIRIQFEKSYAQGEVRPERPINKCTIFGIYGGENDSRVFLSGNADYINEDWYSGLYDATYFPDNGFAFIGNNDSAIMGYIKQYDTQIVVKENNQVDGSAWLRTYNIDETGMPKFTLEQGAVGTGAYSKYAFAYLNAIPIMLSRYGVMKVVGTNVDNQRMIQQASEKINSRLVNELNLDKAIGVEYQDKYYLFVNERVYVCDARMQYTDTLGNTQYEWMLWDKMNATAVKVVNDKLYMGYDGMLFALKPLDMSGKYLDDYFDGVRWQTREIEAYWTTPSLYLGSVATKKRINSIFVLFNKTNRVRCEITATFDNTKTFGLGTFDRPECFDLREFNLGKFTLAGEYVTCVFRESAKFERIDNVSIKLKKIIDDEPKGVSFGADLIQINYQFKDNF